MSMSDWSALKTELAEWRARDMILPVWWRDDDATAMSASLKRLSKMARDYGLVAHLAVIPQSIDVSLSDEVKDNESLICLVHGWQHKNHALTGKKCEFGTDRPLLERTKELQDGRLALRAAFGPKALDVFVPPWNRIGDDLIPELPQLGYQAISTYLPRKTKTAVEGLLQVNTHLDPIDWRGSRSAVSTNQFSEHAARLLKDRRLGETDASEPLGFLSHHLVHDQAIWDLVEAFWDIVMTGQAISVLPFERR